MRAQLASASGVARLALLVTVIGAFIAAETAQATRHAQDQSAPCDRALRQQPWAAWEPRLYVEGPTLSPSGDSSAPQLCVLQFSGDTMYVAVIDGVPSSDQFRVAKAEALDLLPSLGVDPCRVGRWGASGSSAVRLTSLDRRDAGRPCPPVLQPLDPLGHQWLAETEAATAFATRALDETLGWRPTYTVRVLVSGTTEAMLDATGGLRLRLGGALGASYAQYTQERRSYAVTDPLTGSTLSINLANPDLRTAEWVRSVLIHELTHVAQADIVDPFVDLFDSVPKWFAEGQAVQVEKRYTSVASRSLFDAREFLQTGRSYRLSETNSRDDWAAREQGLRTGPVYTRASAFITFLTSRHGSESPGALLRGARGGSREQFYQRLTELTGLGVDDIDGALDRWIESLPVARTQTSGGEFSLELLLVPGRSRMEAWATALEARACGGIVPGNRIPFGSPARADGSFAADAEGTVYAYHIEARVTESGDLAGTIQYRRKETGCQSTPFPFRTPLSGEPYQPGAIPAG
jgi:hypothetical protein